MLRALIRRARCGLPACVAAALAAALSPAPAHAQTGAIERLRLPFPAYDGTLTPYTFARGYPLVTLVYDTLLWRDAAGIPRPWLARSVQRGGGGRRVTVRLRDGVRWHDGRPLTAADVAFTLRFVANRRHPRFSAQVDNIRRVLVLGRLTVAIDLRRPSLGFDDQPLADVPILPEHRWRGLPAGRSAPRGLAVGSGPYRLVSVGRREGYVLRANAGYFRGRPRVGEIRVPIIRDAEPTYEALRERRVDMVPLSLPAETARSLSSLLGIGVRRGPAYTGTALVLNTRRAPFDRPEVRRAVSDALDLARIARGVAPATPARAGFVHPASRWSPGSGRHRFDPAAARPVLEALGSEPIRVLAPSNDPVRLEAGRRVVLAIEAAGGRATLAERSRAQLDRAIGADGSAPDFEAAIDSTPPLVSHDPDYLARLFGSNARAAPLNTSGYRSAAFDALARRVATAQDAAVRRRAVGEELDLLARDAPAIALFFSEGAFAYRSSIYDGWRFVKGQGILDKQSFLPPPAAAAEPAPSADAAGDEAGSEAGGEGFAIVNAISIAVLAIVVVLAGTALVLRRRARRR